MSVALLVVAASMVAVAAAGPVAVAVAGPVVAAVADVVVHNAESENRHQFLRRNDNGIP